MGKKLRTLAIDPEFRDLISPQTDEEWEQLQASILKEGCESPLTLWNSVIVDAHNHYDCAPKRIPFATLEKAFSVREVALCSSITNPLIFVCSPFRGDVETNVRQAERFCRFVYLQQSVPFAPHLIYPQFLDDDDPDERNAGLCMGIEVLNRCDELWAFGEPTAGMSFEITAAICLGKPVRRFTHDCQEVRTDG